MPVAPKDRPRKLSKLPAPGASTQIRKSHSIAAVSAHSSGADIAYLLGSIVSLVTFPRLKVDQQALFSRKLAGIGEGAFAQGVHRHSSPNEPNLGPLDQLR